MKGGRTTGSRRKEYARLTAGQIWRQQHGRGGPLWSTNLTGRIFKTGQLEALQGEGEVGQLIVGLVAGFTVEEIAAKRGWPSEAVAGYVAEVPAVATAIFGAVGWGRARLTW